jgi:hypothetical protein
MKLLAHPRLPLVASLLALCLVAVALLWRPLLRGEVLLPMDTLLHMHPWRYSYERVPVYSPGTTDPIKQIYPRRVLSNEMLRAGALPLWNPSAVTGVSNVADGQLGLFYPPTWLLALLPLSSAFGVYALTQVVLAGAGCFLFARQSGLGYIAATFGGACYMLNGYLTGWLYFPHHVAAMAVLPWCFWAVGRAWGRGRWGDWALASVVCALPALTHFQIALYTYSALGAYALARLAVERRAAIRPAIGFAAATLAALALSAVQLLPALALSAGGQRADIGGALASADEIAVSLLRLAFPLVGGTPRPSPAPWGPDTIIFAPPYAGIAPLLLAAAALLLVRRRLVLFLALLAAGAFALAVSTPLLGLVLALVPPYRQFEDHTRWFALWYFALALLSAFGLQALMGRKHSWGGRAGHWLLAALALGLGGWLLWHLQLFTPRSRYGQYLALILQHPERVSLVVGALSVALVALLAVRRLPRAPIVAPLVAVALLDLLWFCGTQSGSFDPAQIQPTADLLRELPPGATSDQLFPITRQVAFLQAQPGPFRIHGGDYEALPANLAGAFGLEDIRGYLSLYPARYNRLARLIDGKDYSRTGEGNVSLRAYLTTAYEHRRLLDMLNVQYFVFEPGSKNPPLYEPLERVQQNDEGSIYRNPRALPRAFLVHRVEVIPGDDAQLDRLAQPGFDPAASAIVPEALPDVAPATTAEPAPTVTYAPNAAEVRASVSAPALLVLADAYDEGWQALVDGRPAPIIRANYALRGVWLPPGDHTISFAYRPLPVLLGGAISGAALLALAAASLWSALTHRPKTADR